MQLANGIKSANKIGLLKLKLGASLLILVSGCSSALAPGFGRDESTSSTKWRPQQEVPRTQPVDVAQVNQTPYPSRGQSPLLTYNSATDFKAVAANEARVQGAGVGELSLFIAEREALKDCTRRSEYQGDCETVQVGTVGLNGADTVKDRQRWQYMQRVHRNLASRAPLRSSLRSKVLAPGSRVGDATLWLSNSFQAGGFAALQMPNYTCTGTLDPIEQSGSEIENDDKPVGLIEMACQSGHILYGGYASINPQTHLFYLEDKENERWEFMVSDKSASVGYNTTSFKKLFAELEKLD